jgi:16S rRNA (cytidine1402-2'-O)-methyltransferase
MTGTLYLVATPIGNLGDMSPRAITTLQEVDLIAAEDTRHSLPLLRHYGIDTRSQSYHAHNESEQSTKLIQKLLTGESIALISDAGTPLISDPGAKLVQQAQAAGIAVCPIPGPCAAITALCASGLSATDFRFIGFLAAKGERRTRQMQQLSEDPCTLILYESVHRIAALMETLVSTLEPDREVCLARELTKRFEQIKTAPIAELHAWFLDHPDCQKGEYVVIVSGAPAKENDQTEITTTLQLLLAELPLKKAVAITAKLTGERKNSVYDLALKIKEDH